MEAFVNLQVDAILVALHDSGRVKGVQHCYDVSPGAEYLHAVHIVWKNQHPKRRGPLLEPWSTLTADVHLKPFFAGLVEGQSVGRIGIGMWGNKPSDPHAVA